LVNDQRKLAGVPPLVYSKELEQAAQYHSNTQAETNTMTHDDPAGLTVGDRITNTGYDWQRCGENVAFGYDTQEIVMAKWMQSPGHRENILRKEYTSFGSAVAVSDDGTKYWTQDFGTPSSG